MVRIVGQADERKREVRGVKITVRLFAGLKCENEKLAYFGKNEFNAEYPEGTSLSELLDLLGIARDIAKIVFVNGLFREFTYQLCDGDEVAVFPPIGGG